MSNQYVYEFGKLVKIDDYEHMHMLSLNYIDKHGDIQLFKFRHTTFNWIITCRNNYFENGKAMDRAEVMQSNKDKVVYTVYNYKKYCLINVKVFHENRLGWKLVSDNQFKLTDEVLDETITKVKKMRKSS